MRAIFMKQKVFINYPIDENAVEKIRKDTPDLFATQNGEQVLAMVRNGEVERVCIAFGACGFSEFALSKAIHAINPAIPVFIMSSEIPDVFSQNETITTDPGFFFESASDFLKGLFPKVGVL
jgi:hypothetical protein